MPQSGFEEGFSVTTSGSLDTWVKEIHAKVPGAIEGYIYDQVKLVIKDFFQRTKAARRFLGPFSVSAGEAQLCLNPVDAYWNVILVMQVVRNGAALTQTNKAVIPRLFATEQTSSTPSRFYLEPYHTIKFWPQLAIDVEDIYVVAALTPRLRADNRIDQEVLDQHYEAIKAGTLQRLYEEPGKVYTNNTSAEYWGKKYRSELTRSRVIADTDYGPASQPWSFNSWAM